MRFFGLIAIAAVLAAFLSGCSSTGISATASYNPGYGPFDRNGNYVEAWADKPARKHGWADKPAATPAAPVPTPVVTSEPVLLASHTPSPRSSSPTRVTPNSQPTLPVSTRPTTVTRPAASQPPSRPPVIAASTSTRPKPAAASPPKPKPKPKPASISHAVQKGDTLYSLSRRYGTSVSAIQSANGISGTTIRIGQSLKIPK